MFTAGYLGILPATQKNLMEKWDMNPYAADLVGATGAGVLCAFISQPMDTAKTCMQGDVERRKYKGTLHTLRTLRKEYGSIRAMYKGYSLRAANIVFAFVLINAVKKATAPLIFPEKCGQWTNP
jgi:hypothetical protein